MNYGIYILYGGLISFGILIPTLVCCYYSKCNNENNNENNNEKINYKMYDPLLKI